MLLTKKARNIICFFWMNKMQLYILSLIEHSFSLKFFISMLVMSPPNRSFNFSFFAAWHIELIHILFPPELFWDKLRNLRFILPRNFYSNLLRFFYFIFSGQRILLLRGGDGKTGTTSPHKTALSSRLSQGATRSCVLRPENSLQNLVPNRIQKYGSLDTNNITRMQREPSRSRQNKFSLPFLHSLCYGVVQKFVPNHLI